MGTTNAGRRLAYIVRVCVLSVSACLYLISGARAEDSTGTLLYAGSDTLKTKRAANIIVDSTATTGTILTTASLGVNSGDPWRFNGGTELQGIQGDWQLTSTLNMSGQTTTTYSINADLPVSTGTLMNVTSPTLNLTIMTQQYDQYFEPGNVFGGNYLMPSDYFLVCNDQRTSVGSLPLVIDTVPTSGVAGVAYRDGSWRYRPLDTEYSHYGESADVYGSITARTGDITATAGAVWSGAPSGGSLTWGLAGSLNGIYLLISNDGHIQGSGYLREGCVVGFGRQDHTQDGSLWIETKGTGVVPTTGSQEMRVYTSEQGAHFSNKLHAFNEGSTNTAFMFDWDVMTSGSLATSGTLSLEDSDYEGQATIAVTSSTVTVSASVISDTDVVILTYTNLSNGGGALWVDDIDPGVGFDINSSAATSDDTNVNWKIIK